MEWNLLKLSKFVERSLFLACCCVFLLIVEFESTVRANKLQLINSWSTENFELKAQIRIDLTSCRKKNPAKSWRIHSLLNGRNCVWQCETEGLTGGTAIPHCTNETVEEGGWYTKEPLYAQWRQLNCKADCRYHCMMQREEERRLQGLGPVKYHGKWPFLRIFVFQVLIVFPFLFVYLFWCLSSQKWIVMVHNGISDPAGILLSLFISLLVFTWGG